MAITKTTTLVLDATAFYAGIPFTGTSTYYSTPLVIREVSHGKIRDVAIRSLHDANRLVIIEPKEPFLKRVKKVAKESGDVGKISEADISVLALGVQLCEEGRDVTVVSDDYSVENLAKMLGVKQGPVMTRGISKVVNWVVYCRGCGKVHANKNERVCDVCGTTLTRKFAR